MWTISCGPVQSPAAKICGALVCILLFAMTRPLSVFTPAFSRFKDAVFGILPSANKISSAETETRFPFCSNETDFNFPFRCTLKSLVPVKTWMPSRRNTFSISIPASGSNSFKICLLRWIKVTLTPKRAKNCANSQAIAPPPRMMSDLGNRLSATASSLVMKPASLSSGSGDGATLEPVAMTKYFAVSIIPIAQFNGVCIEKFRVGSDEFEFAAVELMDAIVGEIFYLRVFARHDFGEIEGNFSGAHAPRFRVFGEMFDFRCVKQSLRRHAAAQNTKSADFFAAFDDDSFQSGVCRRSCRCITAAATADDCHVEIKSAHDRKMEARGRNAN